MGIRVIFVNGESRVITKRLFLDTRMRELFVVVEKKTIDFTMKYFNFPSQIYVSNMCATHSKLPKKRKKCFQYVRLYFLKSNFSVVVDQHFFIAAYTAIPQK